MTLIDPAQLVGTGGAVGALARYFVARRIHDGRIPLGTLTVNVLGSFVLGLVTFSSPSESVLLFLGTGACGSFTTFSSFSFGTVRLWEEGERVRATANALLNLGGALLALGLAWFLVRVVA